MLLRRLSALVVLLATLAIPASASAGSHRTARAAVAVPRTTALLGAAFEVGLRYWGELPCGGQIQVVAQRPVAVGMATDTDAWVSFSSSLGPNDLSAPAAGYRGCVVAFARRRWPTAASMQQDWDVLCATMTHELGHLLGHVHDTTPGSVMAAVFTDVSDVPATCRASRPGR